MFAHRSWSWPPGTLVLLSFLVLAVALPSTWSALLVSPLPPLQLLHHVLFLPHCPASHWRKSFALQPGPNLRPAHCCKPSLEGHLGRPSAPWPGLVRMAICVDKISTGTLPILKTIHMWLKEKKKTWGICLWLLTHLKLLPQWTLVYNSCFKGLFFKTTKNLGYAFPGSLCLIQGAEVNANRFARKFYPKQSNNTAKKRICCQEWHQATWVKALKGPDYCLGLRFMEFRRSLFTEGHRGGDSLFWLTDLNM